MRRSLTTAIALVATLATACGGRKSAVGFRLPDGDPARGQAVFVSLQCHACHAVAGGGVPAPVAEPPVPVVLGGKVYAALSDGELTTAILNPSYRLAAGYSREAVSSGRLSRMGDFTSEMTARDLIDVVAFLQSRYVVVSPPPPIR